MATGRDWPGPGAGGARGRAEKAGRAGRRRGWECSPKSVASVTGLRTQEGGGIWPGAPERSQAELSVPQVQPEGGVSLPVAPGLPVAGPPPASSSILGLCTGPLTPPPPPSVSQPSICRAWEPASNCRLSQRPDRFQWSREHGNSGWSCIHLHIHSFITPHILYPLCAGHHAGPCSFF